MLNNDIQSKLAHYLLANLTLTAGAIVNVSSAAINTKETNALSLALFFDRVFAGSDALTYKFQESDDGSTNWTDVAVDGNLPYSAEGNVVDVVVGETQNVGVFSTKQYVRITFNGTVDTTDFVITLPYVLALDLTENQRYIAAGLPGDNLP